MNPTHQMRSLVLAASLAWTSVVSAQPLLLIRDFGQLHNLGEEPGMGIITSASRTAGDDDDIVSTSYIDSTNQILVTVTVQTVTEPGWWVHELEGAFRTRDGAELEAGVSITESGARRRFDGSLALSSTTARLVAWPSGTNRIVSVQFELKGANRFDEVPTEIVDAYLELHPSSLPASVDSTETHRETWIRDEMRRLLEYAQRDLGFATLTSEPSATEFWREDARRLLGRFAAYRERFHHVGSGAAFERSADVADRQSLKPNGVTVDPAKQQNWLQARLEQFQTWWAAQRNDPVQLPAPTPNPPPRDDPNAPG